MKIGMTLPPMEPGVDGAVLMKRVGAGEKVVDALLPVGPAPRQSGGPERVAALAG